jgi:phospholipase/lecithinase/hemolysin
MNQDSQSTATLLLTSPLDVTRQGSTSVTLSNDLVNALETLQVQVESFGNTTLADGVAEFPIVGGAADIDSARVDILHDGGLTFSTPNTTVSLTDFIVTNLDNQAVLTGLVTVNGELVTRAPLFDLQVGEVVASEENDRPTLDLENVTATLTSDAAAALNEAFGVSAFASGLSIGNAQVDATLRDPSSPSVSDNNLPGNISELYVFGDFLTDTGNTFRATEEAYGQGFPPSPFFEGRYSNGPLWVEDLASELGVEYNPETNFSSIGSTTGLNNVGNPSEPNDGVEQLGLPGVLGQVNNFVAENLTVDSNGLYVISGGSYDLALPGTTDSTEAVNNIVTAVEELAIAGAQNILVSNIPNPSQTPGGRINPDAAALSGLAQEFNANLANALDELDRTLSPDVNLISLDLNAQIDRLVNNPEQFGVTNVTDPYVVTSPPGSTNYVPTNPGANPDDYAFFGIFQPSATTQDLFAETALSAIATVGEPLSELGTVGDDTIQGANDFDRINGLGGNDRISSEGNASAILGGSGNDTLTGDRGNDSLLGEVGNDILVGGQDNDILNGGANNNYLRGGSDRDTFVLNRNGFATIQDFQDGRDKIDLAGSLTFTDLNIAQQENSTAIQFGETELARLLGVEANSLSANDFTV